jgi:hypothetical protein
MTIRAVWFDVGEVLVDETQTSGNWMKIAFEVGGLLTLI